MPKATAKRKSESALPTGKSKSRKMSPSVESEHSDESSGIFVKDHSPVSKRVKKSRMRKSEPVKKADEYEEDSGREEGRDFLSQYAVAQKKKKAREKAHAGYMKDITKKLKEDEREMRVFIDEVSVASTKKDEKFLETFTDCFLASRPSAPPDSPREYSIDFPFSTLYKKSTTLLKNSRSIIENFAKAEEITSAVEAAELLSNEWEIEDKGLASTFDAGHAAGLEKYEALMRGRKLAEQEKELNGLVEVLYPKDQQVERVGWGRTAQKQEKALGRLVKTLTMTAGD